MNDGLSVETWKPGLSGFHCMKCIHWHCPCAMVLSLLCNHWQFLLGFSVMAKENQNQKTKKNKKKNKKTKWQDPTLCHYSPLGVCNLVFFCFLFFLFLSFWVSCFFGFLFSGSLLVFWRAKDLDLTLCHFSHFRGCKLAFGWFYYLLWACGSIRKQIYKNYGKMQQSLEEAWGAWDTN